MSSWNDECGLRGVSGMNHPDYNRGGIFVRYSDTNQEEPTSNINLEDKEPEARPDETLDKLNCDDIKYTDKELHGENKQQKLHNRDNVEQITKQINRNKIYN